MRIILGIAVRINVAQPDQVDVSRQLAEQRILSLVYYIGTLQ